VIGGVHPAAAQGFDREAEAYERGRPGYPAEAVAFLAETLRLTPGRTVMDLAAGTGKLTSRLVPTGADVIAIEPVAGMRAILQQALPTIRVLDGTAERTGLAAASVDAVTAAQAFHWFDGPRAVAELARVLRPEGRLGIVFNVRDETDPIQATLDGIWAPYRGNTPTHRGGGWRSAFEAVETFTPLVQRAFVHEQRLTPDGLVDRVVSVSFIASLPTPERDQVAEQVLNLVDGRTEATLRYRTVVFWTERVVSGRRVPSPASGSSSPG
jgi:ubiquinone/menaquinone biosynthesis C-methylase UbiE